MQHVVHMLQHAFSSRLQPRRRRCSLPLVADLTLQQHVLHMPLVADLTLHATCLYMRCMPSVAYLTLCSISAYGVYGEVVYLMPPYTLYAFSSRLDACMHVCVYFVR